MRISDWSSDVCSSDLHVEQCARDVPVLAQGHGPGHRKARGMQSGDQPIFPVDRMGRGQQVPEWLASQNISPFAGLDPVSRVGLAAGKFPDPRSEEHTSELQSLMRISYAVFCLKKKK